MVETAGVGLDLEVTSEEVVSYAMSYLVMEKSRPE